MNCELKKFALTITFDAGSETDGGDYFLMKYVVYLNSRSNITTLILMQKENIQHFTMKLNQYYQSSINPVVF